MSSSEFALDSARRGPKRETPLLGVVVRRPPRRLQTHGLLGVAVRRPPRRPQTGVWFPLSLWTFFRSSRASDLKIETPVSTLPGAWNYGVSAGAGWSGVSILWLGEIASLICNFCLGVAAHSIMRAAPSLRYTSMLRAVLHERKGDHYPTRLLTHMNHHTIPRPPFLSWCRTKGVWRLIKRERCSMWRTLTVADRCGRSSVSRLSVGS